MNDESAYEINALQVGALLAAPGRRRGDRRSPYIQSAPKGPPLPREVADEG